MAIKDMEISVTFFADTAEERELVIEKVIKQAEMFGSEVEISRHTLGNDFAAMIVESPSDKMLSYLLIELLSSPVETLRGEKDELDTPDIPASSVGWGSDEVVD